MSLPDFSYEKKLWRKGYQLVIGIDEVGRGSFAGPVVAGAASIKIKSAKLKVQSLGINDSKRLSPQRRERMIPEIKKYFHFGIGQSSVAEINKLGIVKATERAMRRAFRLVQGKQFKGNMFVLVDAFHVKYIPAVGLKNQKAIIKGDQKSISIAAASILAKVYRDGLMKRLSLKYPKYHWGENKGYGTENHIRSIRKYGVTRLHRKKFVEETVQSKLVGRTHNRGLK